MDAHEPYNLPHICPFVTYCVLHVISDVLSEHVEFEMFMAPKSTKTKSNGSVLKFPLKYGWIDNI